MARIGLVIQPFHETIDITRHCRILANNRIGRIKIVITIAHLNNIPGRIPNRAIIFDLNVLGDLDHAALNITTRSGFHGRVCDSLSSRHGVEIEFAWRQSLGKG